MKGFILLIVIIILQLINITLQQNNCNKIINIDTINNDNLNINYDLIENVIINLNTNFNDIININIKSTLNENSKGLDIDGIINSDSEDYSLDVDAKYTQNSKTLTVDLDENESIGSNSLKQYQNMLTLPILSLNANKNKFTISTTLFFLLLNQYYSQQCIDSITINVHIPSKYEATLINDGNDNTITYTIKEITDTPTIAPTNVGETFSPTNKPTTLNPTNIPTKLPTNQPTNSPSSSPLTSTPTKSPTTSPSRSPLTDGATHTPSISPSLSPTNLPSFAPSTTPTSFPSTLPSGTPTTLPSLSPTKTPVTPIYDFIEFDFYDSCTVNYPDLTYCTVLQNFGEPYVGTVYNFTNWYFKDNVKLTTYDNTNERLIIIEVRYGHDSMYNSRSYNYIINFEYDDNNQIYIDDNANILRYELIDDIYQLECNSIKKYEANQLNETDFISYFEEIIYKNITMFINQNTDIDVTTKNGTVTGGIPLANYTEALLEVDLDVESNFFNASGESLVSTTIEDAPTFYLDIKNITVIEEFDMVLDLYNSIPTTNELNECNEYVSSFFNTTEIYTFLRKRQFLSLASYNQTTNIDLEQSIYSFNLTALLDDFGVYNYTDLNITSRLLMNDDFLNNQNYYNDDNSNNQYYHNYDNNENQDKYYANGKSFSSIFKKAYTELKNFNFFDKNNNERDLQDDGKVNNNNRAGEFVCPEVSFLADIKVDYNEFAQLYCKDKYKNTKSDEYEACVKWSTILAETRLIYNSDYNIDEKISITEFKEWVNEKQFKVPDDFSGVIIPKYFKSIEKIKKFSVKLYKFPLTVPIISLAVGALSERVAAFSSSDNVKRKISVENFVDQNTNFNVFAKLRSKATDPDFSYEYMVLESLKRDYEFKEKDEVGRLTQLLIPILHSNSIVQPDKSYVDQVGRLIRAQKTFFRAGIVLELLTNLIDAYDTVVCLIGSTYLTGSGITSVMSTLLIIFRVLSVIPYIGAVFKTIIKIIKFVETPAKPMVKQFGKNYEKAFKFALKLRSISGLVRHAKVVNIAASLGVSKVAYNRMHRFNIENSTYFFNEMICLNDISNCIPSSSFYTEQESNRMLEKRIEGKQRKLSIETSIFDDELLDFLDDVGATIIDTTESIIDGAKSILDPENVIDVFKGLLNVFSEITEKLSFMAPVIDTMNKILSKTISLRLPHVCYKSKNVCVHLPCGVKKCCKKFPRKTRCFPCGVKTCRRCKYMKFPYPCLKRYTFTVQQIIDFIQKGISVLFKPFEAIVEKILTKVDIPIPNLPIPGFNELLNPSLPDFDFSLPEIGEPFTSMADEAMSLLEDGFRFIPDVGDEDLFPTELANFIDPILFPFNDDRRRLNIKKTDEDKEADFLNTIAGVPKNIGFKFLDLLLFSCSLFCNTRKDCKIGCLEAFNQFESNNIAISVTGLYDQTKINNPYNSFEGKYWGIQFFIDFGEPRNEIGIARSFVNFTQLELNTNSPTLLPTNSPLSSSPTKAPVTLSPTKAPLTSSPTNSPLTSSPTNSPLTSSPITSTPSNSPTMLPSNSPLTSSPITSNPTSIPSKSPILGTASPSIIPTSTPSNSPLTSSPTTLSPTIAPTTLNPTANPSRSPIVGTLNPTTPPTLFPTYSPIGTQTPTYLLDKFVFNGMKTGSTSINNLGNKKTQIIGSNTIGSFYAYVNPSVGDFNNDGYNDVLLEPTSNEEFYGNDLILLFGSENFGVSNSTVDLSEIFNNPASSSNIKGVIFKGIGSIHYDANLNFMDVNNDGISDIITLGLAQDLTIRLFIIYGQDNFSDEIVDIHYYLDGTNGFSIILGTTYFIGVNNIGDINNDGYNDFGFVQYNYAGVLAAVVLNKENLNNNEKQVYLDDLIGIDKGFTINSNKIDELSYIGLRIIGCGDFNNDGFNDAVIAGGSKLLFIFGNTTFSETIYTYDNLLNDTFPGLLVYDTPQTLGTSLDTADFNNDNQLDLLIGASNYNTGFYIIYGNDYIELINSTYSFNEFLNIFSYTNVIKSDGGAFGNVRPINDLNGDDLIDFVVSDYLNEGKFYFLYNEQPTLRNNGTVDLSTLNSFEIIGNPNQGLAQFLGVYDINNDGYDDVVACSPGSLNEPVDAGSCYLILLETTL